MFTETAIHPDRHTQRKAYVRDDGVTITADRLGRAWPDVRRGYCVHRARTYRMREPSRKVRAKARKRQRRGKKKTRIRRRQSEDDGSRYHLGTNTGQPRARARSRTQKTVTSAARTDIVEPERKLPIGTDQNDDLTYLRRVTRYHEERRRR